MGRRVLVVEDNPTNRALMEYLLRAYGHTVLSATDGLEGIACARRESPDVILMDLQMPNMNGFEAVRVLKAQPALSRVPIVAVTASAMVGDRDKILSSGFDGYISKPITPETFVDQVQAFLSAAAQRAESPDAGPATKATILAVDNSPVNLSLVRSTLEPFGYDVLTAGTAREALDLARARSPDLILSDVHMPGQSGYDFLQIVKRDAVLRSIPFVFISSTVWGDAERRTGLQQGADAFILRPIEPRELIDEIARLLGGVRRD
jgi:two-component system cell cycle response regulator